MEFQDGLQDVQRQAEDLRSKLAEAAAEQVKAKAEAAGELAAARAAWELRRRHELQVCKWSGSGHLQATMW
jgi:multidrug resistance efflux pump